MNITKELLVKKLSQKSGYFQQDVKHLLNCLDEVVLESFLDVEEGEDVSIQVIEGCKLTAHLLPERQRIDPRDRSEIICSPTVSVGVKYSRPFKYKIQELYESKKDG